MSADPAEYPELHVVEWVDTTNIASWENLADVHEWAKDGGFICRNVGYIVHEDDDCVVLAARIAVEAEPPQIGLFERVPKGVIVRRWVAAVAPDQPTDEHPLMLHDLDAASCTARTESDDPPDPDARCPLCSSPPPVSGVAGNPEEAGEK